MTLFDFPWFLTYFPFRPFRNLVLANLLSDRLGQITYRGLLIIHNLMSLLGNSTNQDFIITHKDLPALPLKHDRTNAQHGKGPACTRTARRRSHFSR